MQTAYSLEALYRSHYNLNEDNLDILKQFFKKTLDVADATWTHYLDELRKAKTDGSEDFDWISDLYTLVDEVEGGLMEKDKTRLKYVTFWVLSLVLT